MPSADLESSGPVVFDFGAIATDLEELPEAICNRIWREMGNELRQLHGGLPALLTNTVSVAHWTWRAVRLLTLERRHREPPLKELAVAIPPLARTLLESLMTMIFLFDDPSDRTAWYYASGWREARELQISLEARHRDDPVWTDYLEQHGGWVESHERDIGVRTDERAHPETVTRRWPKPGWWPTPPRMPKYCTTPARADFLNFVLDRYYGELSQDTHLSYMGLARRGGILHDQHADTVRRERYRSDALFRALSFHVGLLSEVALSVGLPQELLRLKRIWDRLRVHSCAQELWEARYDATLEGRP